MHVCDDTSIPTCMYITIYIHMSVHCIALHYITFDYISLHTLGIGHLTLDSGHIPTSIHYIYIYSIQYNTHVYTYEHAKIHTNIHTNISDIELHRLVQKLYMNALNANITLHYKQAYINT